jgi:hypothetical protein
MRKRGLRLNDVAENKIVVPNELGSSLISYLAQKIAFLLSSAVIGSLLFGFLFMSRSSSELSSTNFNAATSNFYISGFDELETALKFEGVNPKYFSNLKMPVSTDLLADPKVKKILKLSVPKLGDCLSVTSSNELNFTCAKYDETAIKKIFTVVNDVYKIRLSKSIKQMKKLDSYFPGPIGLKGFEVNFISAMEKFQNLDLSAQKSLPDLGISEIPPSPTTKNLRNFLVIAFAGLGSGLVVGVTLLLLSLYFSKKINVLTGLFQFDDNVLLLTSSDLLSPELHAIFIGQQNATKLARTLILVEDCENLERFVERLVLEGVQVDAHRDIVSWASEVSKENDSDFGLVVVRLSETRKSEIESVQAFVDLHKYQTTVVVLPA